MTKRTLKRLHHLADLCNTYLKLQTLGTENIDYLMDVEDLDELIDILGEEFELKDLSNLLLQLNESIDALGQE